MIAWGLACAASAAYVCLKAFQQLNVQHDKFAWIPPTSLLMAVCEVTIVTGIVKATSLWIALPLGVGGAIGCLAAMLIHRKLRG